MKLRLRVEGPSRTTLMQGAIDIAPKLLTTLWEGSRGTTEKEIA
jgi:hypothetical protein